MKSRQAEDGLGLCCLAGGEEEQQRLGWWWRVEAGMGGPGLWIGQPYTENRNLISKTRQGAGSKRRLGPDPQDQAAVASDRRPAAQLVSLSGPRPALSTANRLGTGVLPVILSDTVPRHGFSCRLAGWCFFMCCCCGRPQSRSGGVQSTRGRFDARRGAIGTDTSPESGECYGVRARRDPAAALARA